MHARLCGFLRLLENRAADRKTAFGKSIFSDQASRFRSDEFVDMTGAALKGFGIQSDRRGLITGHFLDADHTLFLHPPQHVVSTLAVCFQIIERTQFQRIAQDGYDRCGFAHRQVLGFLAEIAERCRAQSVVSAAQKGAVHKKPQNFVLAVAALDALRQEYLDQLAVKSRLPSLFCFGLQPISIAGQLLGYRARALGHLTAIGDHFQTGTSHTDVIDAFVAVEAAVFAGFQRVDEIFRNILKCHHAAVFNENPANFTTIPVQNDTGHLDFVDALEVVSECPLAELGTIRVPNHQARNSQQQDKPEKNNPKAFSLVESFFSALVSPTAPAL